MKVDEYEIMEGLYYTKEHEWAKVAGNKVTVGIDDYAQKLLKDVVYVELPEKGTKVEHMKEFGIVESVKTVSDLYAPVSGTVVDINVKLDDEPELVNAGPYKAGWMLVIEPSNLETDLANLMNAESYAEYLKKLMEEHKE
jgi:glycine cleavage system H protein